MSNWIVEETTCQFTFYNIEGKGEVNFRVRRNTPLHGVLRALGIRQRCNISQILADEERITDLTLPVSALEGRHLKYIPDN